MNLSDSSIYLYRGKKYFACRLRINRKGDGEAQTECFWKVRRRLSGIHIYYG